MTSFKHQTEAYERHRDDPAVALFLEQGLGKSKIALDIIQYRYDKGDIEGAIIIAPNGVHKQWAKEQIPKWVNVPYECIIRGGKLTSVQKRQVLHSDNRLKFLCVNIDSFSHSGAFEDVTEFHSLFKTAIVLDEATSIKNLKAQRTQRLLYSFNNIKRRGRSIIQSMPLSIQRMILTGTPVTNGAFDVWSMFEFIKPNFFERSYWSFQNYYALCCFLSVNGAHTPVVLTRSLWQTIHEAPRYEDVQIIYWGDAAVHVPLEIYSEVKKQDEFKGAYRHLDELKERMSTISTFKRITDCLDMPERHYVTREVEMGDEQARCYREMEKDYATALYLDVATAKNKMTAYMRLSQITAGFLSADPILDPDSDILPSRHIHWFEKVPKIDRLLLDVGECEGAVIVCTRYTAEAAHLFDLFSKTGKRVCLQTGWKRIGPVEEFQQGKYDIMVCNTRVMSRGFNLQNSHAIFFYSNSFSLEDRLQMEGRVFRAGQTHPCIYTDYICTEPLKTVDEAIVESLKRKQSLLDYIRS